MLDVSGEGVGTVLGLLFMVLKGARCAPFNTINNKCELLRRGEDHATAKIEAIGAGLSVEGLA